MSNIFTLAKTTTMPYKLNEELVELIKLNMSLLKELELYFKDFPSIQPFNQKVDACIQDSAINIIASPTSTFSPQTTFIYNINSGKRRYEIQQKYNCKLPFPLTSPSSNTPSTSYPSPSPTPSSKKSTCVNLFKFLKKLKTKFQCKPSPPQKPVPITSTFDYKHQFDNIFKLEKWNIEVPAFLALLTIFFKDQKFLQQKGIFRLSSNIERLNYFINEFKNVDKQVVQELNLNPNLLTQFHLEPCDALKRWLRELPEKVFNSTMNKNLEAIAKLGITNDSVELLKALVFQIDPSKQHILKYVLSVSRQVLKYTDTNCMDAQCLSRTIGPNLFSLEASSIHSFNWSIDILKLLLSKDVDYWFTIPTTE